jgi:hypothetical protein
VLDALQVAALEEADELEDEAPPEGAPGFDPEHPAWHEWVEELTAMQEKIIAAAAAAGEAGCTEILWAVLDSPQARHMAGSDEGNAWDARRLVARRCCTAMDAALCGALRSGHGGIIDWLGELGARQGVPDVIRGRLPPLLPAGLWVDSLCALFGARVTGGAAPRGPFCGFWGGGSDAFDLLGRVVRAWPAEGWVFAELLHAIDYPNEVHVWPFRACVYDGELMAWLAAQGHPREWATYVRSSTAGQLLTQSAGADAFRAAVEWLAVAEWFPDVAAAD